MKKQADRAFVEALSKFANLEFLTDGEHGYDYSIEVPRGVRLTDFEERLIAMEFDIYDRFGVRVTAFPVTGAYPDAPGWHDDASRRVDDDVAGADRSRFAATAG